MSEDKFFIPHATECWAPALAKGGVNAGAPLSFVLMDPCDSSTTDDLKTVTYDNASWLKLKSVPGHEALPAFANAVSILSPVVDPLEGKDNVADLQFVSEGSVLQAIRVRYKKRTIYTNVGRIVVALNPFEKRDDLYNDTVIKRYSKNETPYALPPHVFQISAGAFKGMAEDGINQSTLITGESGNYTFRAFVFVCASIPNGSAQIAAAVVRNFCYIGLLPLAYIVAFLQALERLNLQNCF